MSPLGLASKSGRLNAAGKLMSTFNDAVLTVQRRRSDGRQAEQVTHQQVAVGAGGKAIVAGPLKGRGEAAAMRGKRVCHLHGARAAGQRASVSHRALHGRGEG
jgi:hypothetical protein